MATSKFQTSMKQSPFAVSFGTSWKSPEMFRHEKENQDDDFNSGRRGRENRDNMVLS